MQILSFPQVYQFCPLFPSNGTEIGGSICLIVSYLWEGRGVLSCCVHYSSTE